MLKYLYTVVFLSVVLVSCSPKNTAFKAVYIPDKPVILSKKQQAEKEAILLEAKKYSMLSKLEEARDEYLKAIKIDPTCSACYYEMSMIYYRAGHMPQAEKFSRIANKIDSTNVWYQRQYAQLAFNTRNYREAEEYYKRVLASAPNQPDSYFNLAAVYENQSEFPKAIALYDSVQMRFGFTDEVAFRKHHLFLQQGEYGRAIDEASELVKNNPDDARYLVFLGDSYAQGSRDSLARQAYNDALEIDPNYPHALAGKAEILRKTGDFDGFFVYLKDYINSPKVEEGAKAEYLNLLLQLPSFSVYYKNNFDTVFMNVSKMHPNSAELMQSEAAFLAQTDRIDSALVVLHEMVDLDSLSVDKWYRLLSFEHTVQKWKELEKDSRRATVLFPNDPMIHFYLGLALWQDNKIKETIQVLEKAQNMKNVEPLMKVQIHTVLGDLYYTDGDSKKSFEYYEKVLAVDSLNAMVLNNYAYHLSILGKDIPRAYKMSKKAIELESGNVSYLDTYAWILYLQGKYQESKTIFRQAISQGGKEHSVILDHYADVLYKLGEYDTASVYWNMALEMPDCENPDEIREKLNKLKK